MYHTKEGYIGCFIGQVCNNGFAGKLYVNDGGIGGEEVACCARVKNGPFDDGIHVDVYCANAVAASAFWVGIGQEGYVLWFSLILLLLSAPAYQKMLYQL